MLVFVLNQAQKANTGKSQTPVYENVREFGVPTRTFLCALHFCGAFSIENQSITPIYYQTFLLVPNRLNGIESRRTPGREISENNAG